MKIVILLVLTLFQLSIPSKTFAADGRTLDEMVASLQERLSRTYGKKRAPLEAEYKRLKAQLEERSSAASAAATTAAVDSALTKAGVDKDVVAQVTTEVAKTTGGLSGKQLATINAVMAGQEMVNARMAGMRMLENMQTREGAAVITIPELQEATGQVAIIINGILQGFDHQMRLARKRNDQAMLDKLQKEFTANLQNLRGFMDHVDKTEAQTEATMQAQELTDTGEVINSEVAKLELQARKLESQQRKMEAEEAMLRQRLAELDTKYRQAERERKRLETMAAAGGVPDEPTMAVEKPKKPSKPSLRKPSDLAVSLWRDLKKKAVEELRDDDENEKKVKDFLIAYNIKMEKYNAKLKHYTEVLLPAYQAAEATYEASFAEYREKVAQIVGAWPTLEEACQAEFSAPLADKGFTAEMVRSLESQLSNLLKLSGQELIGTLQQIVGGSKVGSMKKILAAYQKLIDAYNVKIQQARVQAAMGGGSGSGMSRAQAQAMVMAGLSPTEQAFAESVEVFEVSFDADGNITGLVPATALSQEEVTLYNDIKDAEGLVGAMVNILKKSKYDENDVVAYQSKIALQMKRIKSKSDDSAQRFNSDIALRAMMKKVKDEALAALEKALTDNTTSDAGAIQWIKREKEDFLALAPITGEEEEMLKITHNVDKVLGQLRKFYTVDVLQRGVTQNRLQVNKGIIVTAIIVVKPEAFQKKALKVLLKIAKNIARQKQIKLIEEEIAEMMQGSSNDEEITMLQEAHFDVLKFYSDTPHKGFEGNPFHIKKVQDLVEEINKRLDNGESKRKIIKEYLKYKATTQGLVFNTGKLNVYYNLRTGEYPLLYEALFVLAKLRKEFNQKYEEASTIPVDQRPYQFLVEEYKKIKARVPQLENGSRTINIWEFPDFGIFEGIMHKSQMPNLQEYSALIEELVKVKAPYTSFEFRKALLSLFPYLSRYPLFFHLDEMPGKKWKQTGASKGAGEKAGNSNNILGQDLKAEITASLSKMSAKKFVNFMKLIHLFDEALLLGGGNLLTFDEKEFRSETLFTHNDSSFPHKFMSDKTFPQDVVTLLTPNASDTLEGLVQKWLQLLIAKGLLTDLTNENANKAAIGSVAWLPLERFMCKAVVTQRSPGGSFAQCMESDRVLMDTLGAVNAGNESVSPLRTAHLLMVNPLFRNFHLLDTGTPECMVRLVVDQKTNPKTVEELKAPWRKVIDECLFFQDLWDDAVLDATATHLATETTKQTWPTQNLDDINLFLEQLFKIIQINKHRKTDEIMTTMISKINGVLNAAYTNLAVYEAWFKKIKGHIENQEFAALKAIKALDEAARKLPKHDGLIGSEAVIVFTDSMVENIEELEQKVQGEAAQQAAIATSSDKVKAAFKDAVADVERILADVNAITHANAQEQRKLRVEKLQKETMALDPTLPACWVHMADTDENIITFTPFLAECCRWDVQPEEILKTLKGTKRRTLKLVQKTLPSCGYFNRILARITKGFNTKTTPPAKKLLRQELALLKRMGTLESLGGITEDLTAIAEAPAFNRHQFFGNLCWLTERVCPALLLDPADFRFIVFPSHDVTAGSRVLAEPDYAAAGLATGKPDDRFQQQLLLDKTLKEYLQDASYMGPVADTSAEQTARMQALANHNEQVDEKAYYNYVRKYQAYFNAIAKACDVDKTNKIRHQLMMSALELTRFFQELDYMIVKEQVNMTQTLLASSRFSNFVEDRDYQELKTGLSAQGKSADATRTMLAACSKTLESHMDVKVKEIVAGCNEHLEAVVDIWKPFSLKVMEMTPAEKDVQMKTIVYKLLSAQPAPDYPQLFRWFYYLHLAPGDDLFNGCFCKLTYKPAAGKTVAQEFTERVEAARVSLPLDGIEDWAKPTLTTLAEKVTHRVLDPLADFFMWSNAIETTMVPNARLLKYAYPLRGH